MVGHGEEWANVMDTMMLQKVELGFVHKLVFEKWYFASIHILKRIKGLFVVLCYVVVCRCSCGMVCRIVWCGVL